jgi:hypothetical protein
MTFISSIRFQNLMQRMIFSSLTHRCTKICKLLNMTWKFDGHLSDNDQVNDTTTTTTTTRRRRQSSSPLSSWSRVLLEKLTGFQLVKKFPAFYGTPKVHYRIHKCPPPVPVSSSISVWWLHGCTVASFCLIDSAATCCNKSLWMHAVIRISLWQTTIHQFYRPEHHTAS